MSEIILAALGLTDKVLGLMNLREMRKYKDRILEIKLAILDEEKRGYHTDDARIENLYKELKVTLEAAANEVVVINPTQPASE